MTQGMRSTEFWVAVAVFASGAALVVAGLLLGRDSAIVAGALQQAAAGAGYAASRGRTKVPRPYLPPTSRI